MKNKSKALTGKHEVDGVLVKPFEVSERSNVVPQSISFKHKGCASQNLSNYRAAKN